MQGVKGFGYHLGVKAADSQEQSFQGTFSFHSKSMSPSPNVVCFPM
jgi:hypothetical protein